MAHIPGPSCFMTVIVKQYEYGSFESNVFEKHYRTLQSSN